ncbi:MAG TPA: fumarylacetoacetate hydrolase family protein [Thermomicrobiales bacterium]|mgnify:CR=1 FL=1|jgi:2-keto-4-pentenoate hydratase/2-oxohepta-3-ene-1,7-dioic acid hydratase in catechol pathway|nr:fumarylacetoacetate hydrolase [Chloroflexota bacterium]HCG30962.1 fumarylacetoacetate hydrolase [Chloroflexota bacterium]HQX63011.1 fumarylacetoacetate hydrolase family protein [Thermomicrobiales bacterium]HQZ89224.1 fumarylacetoacetate hydrolase family protein [Thermomicrobiales bacterium]HRA32829.1 fumarylacetoacetate hydrolase family protein [Thermomicrobiales bacterium]
MRVATFGDGMMGVVADDETVVEITDLLEQYEPPGPEHLLPDLIEHFDALRPELARRVAAGGGTPVSEARLGAPLIRPSKIICLIGNYREGTDRPLQILDIFFKSPEAIVGHGGTVALPSHQTSIFHHEAEIAVVVGREAKNLSDDNAMDAVFGYTVFEDISARSGGRPGIVSFLGKSYDTFAGFGPWITTSDEIADPQALHITVDVNGERRQDYSTADMERPIRELMTYLSSVTTLNPGDVICCGTNHQGLGAVQNGDEVITTIDGIGSFTLHVRDDLGREWQRGIDHEMAERVKAMAQNPAHQQNGEQAS